MRPRPHSALGAVAAVAVAAVAALAAQQASAKTCVPSTVYYRDVAGAHDIGFRGHNPPWVGANGVVGFLFYYGLAPFARTHSARAYVTTGGRVRGGSTKVLWWFRRGDVGAALTITGRRLDGSGSFRQVYRTVVAGPAFPSYLVVPDAGCWRVTVSSGAARAAFVFGAFRDRG